MVQNHLPHDHGQTIEQELEHMPSVENFQTVLIFSNSWGMGAVSVFFGCCVTVRNAS